MKKSGLRELWRERVEGFRASGLSPLCQDRRDTFHPEFSVEGGRGG